LGLDWIGLAQNTDKWWSLMNTVMNFRGISLWGQKQSFKEGLCAISSKLPTGKSSWRMKLTSKSNLVTHFKKTWSYTPTRFRSFMA
jgi:hypothetical protein